MSVPDKGQIIRKADKVATFFSLLFLMSFRTAINFSAKFLCTLMQMTSPYLVTNNEEEVTTLVTYLL